MTRYLVGYDPGRVAELIGRIGGAIDHLEAFGSDDPAAAEALGRVAVVRFELDTLWLPMLRTIAADRSMSGWMAGIAGGTTAIGAAGGTTAIGAAGGTTAIGAAGGTTAIGAAGGTTAIGAAGGTTAIGAAGGAGHRGAVDVAVAELDRVMGRLRDGDRRALDDLRSLLDRHGNDPEVMAALLAAWGPAGFFDNLAIVAGYGTTGAELAGSLVGALDHAADPDGFGTALGTVAAQRMGIPPTLPTDAFTYASAYAVTAFIADGGHAPPGFAVALAGGVTDRAMAGGQFVGPHGAPSLLPGEPGHDGVAFLHDPVQGALGTLAADPAAAAAFYADPARARYVFVDHHFDDGYTALFTSWAAACADAGSRDPARAPTAASLHAANLVATQGVAWIAARDGFHPDDVSTAASVAAAEVVTTHMIAVERTVVAPDGVHLAGGDLADVGLPALTHESTAPSAPVEVALFDTDGLALLVGAAGSSDAGVEIVRAGSAAFHRNTAAGLATELSAALGSGVDPAVLGQRFAAVVARAGHLEGYLLGTMWQVRQGTARERDRLLTFWLTSAASGLGFGVGRTPLNPLAVALPVVGRELTGALATSEAEAMAAAGHYADEQAGRLMFVFTAALADVGLVAMPGASDGRGPTYEEFTAVPAAEQAEFWNALERGEAGSGLALVLTTARDAIKVEQADLYDAG